MTKKITELNALTAPATADIIEIVDDVAVTPTSKKIALSDLWKVVNSFTATTSPQDGDYIPLYSTSDSAIRKILKGDLISGSVISEGWVSASETWTYASADAPTYTFTIASFDATSKYSVGMRIKLTQTTARYFIITKVVFDDPGSTITIYGGTDYELLDGEITLTYYSSQKAPLGFPLDPTKWTVITTDTSERNQLAPTEFTWYNNGSLSISIPIGAWNVYYRGLLQPYDASSGTWNGQTTLSTANNSETDVDLTCIFFAAGVTALAMTATSQKQLILTSKTVYYLNERAASAGLDGIDLRGDILKTIIRAVCAYL